MKMKKDHFDKLKSLITQTIRNYPDAKKEYDRIPFNGGAMRYRWDLLHASKIGSSFFNELYSYLHDDHIDTALRKIVSDFEKEE